MGNKIYRTIGFLVLTITMIVIAGLYSYSYSYAEESNYVINRSEYEEENSEYYSNQSNSSVRQEISFDSITINGISGLKEPTIEQDKENHVTKYEFVVDDEVVIGEKIHFQFNTHATYHRTDGTSSSPDNQPVITVNKADADRKNASKDVNIKSLDINNTQAIDITGNLNCTVYYVFGTINRTVYELQINFKKSNATDNTDYLKDFSVFEESGVIVDNPSKTKNIAVIAADDGDDVTFQIKTASTLIVPVIYNITVDDSGTISEGSSIDLTKNEDTYFISLPAAVDGNKYCLKLVYNDSSLEQYIITVYKRKLKGLPDQVTEYLCAPSQYTNNRGAAGYYGTTRRALLSLRGANTYSTSSDDSDLSPVSLGNFGGYITYYYKDAITDNPNNPYGIDFLIAGNSIINDALYAEPGNVYVSEDGKDWYLLAGSLHYDDDAIWNATVKYAKNDNGTSKVTLQDQSVIENYQQYPDISNYPLFSWDDDNKQEMSFSGLMLKPDKDADSYSNSLPPYPAFGYADCGTPSESNEADNPYTGVGIGKTNKVESSGRKDGFDLAWAVDSNGKPHKFENGVHYIKIQTNTFINNAQTGINEKSTEINFVRKAEPAPVAIGKTYDIEKDSSGRSGINITVDGKQLELKEGTYEYDAAVNGIFDVQVDTRLDSNVYINSWHGNKATFDKAAHGIVRVIIQYGSCEPAIYYINVSQEQDDNAVTAVTFDAGKGEGLISGYTKRTQYYDKDSSVKDFPVPVHTRGKVFGGWLDADGNRYTRYSEDMPEGLTLTAEWLAPIDNAKLIEEITKQIEEIQKQLDQVIAEAASASAASSETISQQTAKIDELNKALTEAQEKLKEMSEQSTVDNTALEKAKKELAEAVTALEQAQKQISQADEDNAAVREALLKAQKELAKAKAKVEELKVKALKVKGVKVKAMKKKAKVSWNSLGKGYSYEVFKSTKKNKGFKKAKTVKATKVTLKKLKSGKKLYFKVRAFKKLNGKKVYTGYSKVVKAKIK